MKTVLIATHQISFSDPESLYNCLGVLTLSAGLKKRGLECEVLDLFEFNNLYSRDSSEILNLISEKIIDSKPKILGFSAMINNLAVALDLARRVKEKLPDLHVVFGGPGTAFCAGDVLQNFSQVDVIFRGEVDFIFPDYVESFAAGKPVSHFPGMIYRNQNNEIVDNGWPEPVKNLDDLPIPDFYFGSNHDLEDSSESFGDYKGISIETGRGCPFTCNFCSTSLYFKRKYRLKSITRIIEEIRVIQKKIGRARIIFNHDLFTLNRKYLIEFCQKVKIELPELVWKCHARLDTLDEEILTLMNEAGCNEIFVGLESATEKMQKIIQKKLDINKFDLLLDIPKRLNMKFSLSFIIGFPEEDENDIKEIFRFCIKAKYNCRDKVQVKIHSVAPLTGSPLYNQWKDQLVYDDYGCMGTSDIPYSWTSLRQVIKRHPEIFSLYFHLPIGEKQRINSSKFVYLGLLVEKLMSHSFYLVYEVLGDQFADVLVENVEKVVLPPASSLKNSEYNILAESVKKIISENIAGKPELDVKFKCLADYEMAIMESYRLKNNNISDFVRIMKSCYNPAEVIKNIAHPKPQSELPVSIGNADQENMREKTFMIFRNKNEDGLKSIEVNPEFAALLTK